jgi:hypothetical protein
MEETRINENSERDCVRRWDRADHAFTVASVALIISMVIAGLGAWIFGNSDEGQLLTQVFTGCIDRGRLHRRLVLVRCA